MHRPIVKSKLRYLLEVV